MKRVVVLLGITILVWAPAGCQQRANDGQPAKSAPADLSQQQAEGHDPAGFTPMRPAKKYDDPQLAVRDFLHALRAGDDKTASAMLTTKAQEEAWRAQSAISPPGSQTAQFQVSEVEYINDKQGAHVLSTWRDVNNRGEKEEYEIIWILRHEPHGWGVAGMATKFLEGADPLILNFENHAEMLARRRWAEQEISRHAQQSATPQHAQRSADSQVR